MMGLFVLSLFCAQASDLGRSFPPGSGARFMMTTQGVSTSVTISIADYSKSKLGVEYYFTSYSGLKNIEMWQQFVMNVPEHGPLKLEEGYVFSKELKTPEKMDPEHLKGFDGVQMDDFLFADPDAFASNRIGKGTEKIEVPAGTLEATHYRKSNNGQTIDFWISDAVKPIGTVQIISSGLQPTHNYKLQLESLLTNVKPKIDRASAKPLSKTGREMLATPAH